MKRSGKIFVAGLGSGGEASSALADQAAGSGGRESVGRLLKAAGFARWREIAAGDLGSRGETAHTHVSTPACSTEHLGPSLRSEQATPQR